MKTELTLAERRNEFSGFEEMSNEEMNKVSGGEDFYVEFDKTTGKFYIVVQPRR